MSAFTHFDPPRQRLRLLRGPVAVELWPEVAGAVASMRWLGAGAPVGLGQHPFLHRPLGSRLQVQADPSGRHVIVYSPPAGPFVCVEPATHMPDAANLALLDASVQPMPLVAPGEALQVRHSIRYHPAAQ